MPNMSYPDKNLLQNEQVLFRTKKHIIIFFFPVVLAVISYFAYFSMSNQVILARIAWAPALVTLIFWINVYLEYITSKFVVTNRRVILQEGFFFRHSNDMRLNAIAQINVDQTLLGRILDYGILSLNTFGGTVDSFSMIAKPYYFQKAVNEQLDNLSTNKSI